MYSEWERACYFLVNCRFTAPAHPHFQLLPAAIAIKFINHCDTAQASHANKGIKPLKQRIEDSILFEFIFVFTPQLHAICKLILGKTCLLSVRPEFSFLQLYRLGYLEMHSREIGEGFLMFNRLRLEVKSRTGLRADGSLNCSQEAALLQRHSYVALYMDWHLFSLKATEKVYWNRDYPC